MANIIYINKGGKYSDNYAREDLLRYMADCRKTQSKYMGGFFIYTYDPIKDMQRVAAQFDKDNGVRLHHFVVAFHPSRRVDLNVLKTCIDSLVIDLGTRFQSFYAIHLDRDHIHFHLALNSVSWVDGKKFYANKTTMRWVEGAINDALQFCGEKYSHFVYDE